MENESIGMLPPPPEIPSHPRRRHALLIGFIALLPLMLSLFVLSLLWQVIDSTIGPTLGTGITWVATKTGILEKAPPPWVGTVAALLLVVLVTYLMGLAIVNIFGPRLTRWTDTLFSSLPVVRHIYPYSKQLSEFLFGARKLNFNRVVITEYPSKGIWSLGFITSDGIPAASRKVGMPLIAVFIPTSPTPFTGWVILVPESEVKAVEMTVDEAVRFIVSCGVILPGQPVTMPSPAETLAGLREPAGKK